MRSQAFLGSAACLTVITLANPIGSPLQLLEKRNILVPGYLIPTTVPNPATWTGSQIISPDRMPTSTVDLAKREEAETIGTVIYSTGFPDLVPTTTVDLATDTTGVRTISPLLMPTAVAQIDGISTSGCVVTMNSRSYVTHCSQIKTPVPTSTGVSHCCGGIESLYACEEDGSIPEGPDAWTCTYGITTCAGITTATSTWV